MVGSMTSESAQTIASTLEYYYPASLLFSKNQVFENSLTNLETTIPVTNQVGGMIRVSNSLAVIERNTFSANGNYEVG